MADNRCVCCGEIIPEGMIACPNCLVVSKKKTEQKMANEKRLIDANALIRNYEAHRNLYIDAWGSFSQMPTIDKVSVDTIDTCISDVINAPTVDAVEVVHGEWIRCLGVDDVEYIECPICGGEFYDGDNDTFDKPHNYCPNCGAKMDGDGNV